MNIWEILDIEPTTDIRVIKKAYATKTKLIHPEEKPEEFRILYEAYQAASWQAKIAKRGKDIPQPFDEKEEMTHTFTAPDQESEEKDSQDPKEEELLTYFAKNRELEEKRLAAAADYWKDVWKKYRRPEEKEEFKSYLNSKEFRDIQWHPQVIRLLVEEFQQPMYYRYDELWLYLWELYGFREEEIVYQEDVQKLRRILYPAFLRRKEEQEQKERYERNRRAEEKREEIYRKIRHVILIALCIAAPFFIYFAFTDHQRLITRHMAQKYPDVEFSKPKRGEMDEEGRRCYHFTSSSHPEFEITAVIKYWEYDGSSSVVEDYGSLLMEYYAEQYDLKFGRVEGSHTWYIDKDCPGTLYYSEEDLTELEDFCERVIRMFQEQKELQCLDFTGICIEGALYPGELLRGGNGWFRVPASQLYRPWEMAPQDLAGQVEEAYIEYMFNYEPWNLTLQQYKELGPKYEEMCKEVKHGKRGWYTVYDAGEPICDLCVRTYEVNYSTQQIGNMKATVSDTKLSIGNAYYYLLAQGVEPMVFEDGTGFEIEYEGERIRFGEDPYIDFKELKSLCPEPEIKKEEPENIRVIIGPELEIEE